jgi:biotin synthase
MKTEVAQILLKENFSKKDIINLLSTTDTTEANKLYEKAYNIKKKYVGNKVYLRGLVEFSNLCKKNCYYCGIRSGNKKLHRYNIPDAQIKKSVAYALKNNFGSVIFQSGERDDSLFIEQVNNILKTTKRITNNKIGITLSCGEQTKKTYEKWYDSGAHRYLLRIETSSKDLYYKIHPENNIHNFETRLKALKNLKKIGYQTGTGVMIGLPYQTIENLADDLLFFKNIDIDMVGMGPYIEHPDTPLYNLRHLLMSKKERFNLTLRMIAVLRIMMKDINIASTTALQSIMPDSRKKALISGANVIMPDLTPVKYIKDYFLYENKPCLDEGSDEYLYSLEKSINQIGEIIGYKKWGDPKHYFERQKK